MKLLEAVDELGNLALDWLVDDRARWSCCLESRNETSKTVEDWRLAVELSLPLPPLLLLAAAAAPF